jgi:type II secretory pathway pseudopilin PulG
MLPLDFQTVLKEVTAERDAAIAREKALLASNQEERTALVEAASLRRERDALRSQLATAQNEAARTRMILQAVKAYEAGEPSQPPVTGMPKRALIDTPSAPSPEAVARAALAEFPSDDDREWIDNRADQLFRESERRRGGVRPATITPQDFRDYFVVSATAERLASIIAKAGEGE